MFQKYDEFKAYSKFSNHLIVSQINPLQIIHFKTLVDFPQKNEGGYSVVNKFGNVRLKKIE